MRFVIAFVVALTVCVTAGLAVANSTASVTDASTPPTPTQSPDPNAGVFFGDFDCNNLIEMDDAMIGLEALAFADVTVTGTVCEPNGDLDCDGEFTGVDMLAIVRFVAELPLTFPGCPTVGDIQFNISTDCLDLETPLAIPDGGETTLQFEFPESEEILGIALCLDIDHPFIGDLVLTLKHDDTATVITLADRVGKPTHSGNCTGHDQGLIVLFADSGDETMQEHCADAATSEFLEVIMRPEELLGAFNGEDVHGTWTVTIADAQAGNTGVVLGATFTYIFQPDDSALSTQSANPHPEPVEGPSSEARHHD